MNTVKTMLDIKGHEVYSIGPDATVHQAVELMAAREIGALIVVTRDNYLAGIVSERDYARKVLLKNKSSQEGWKSELDRSKKKIHQKVSNEMVENKVWFMTS